LGARAPALTASTLPPLSVWPCGPPWRMGKHKGAQTASGPSQSPSRSLETARPVGRCLCPGLLPLGEGFGIPNRPPEPSKHPSVDGHGLLGWLARKAGPLPASRDGGAHDRRSRLFPAHDRMARGKGGPDASSPGWWGTRPAEPIVGSTIPAHHRTCAGMVRRDPTGGPRSSLSDIFRFSLEGKGRRM
jgi:hypothetical protein